MWLTPTELAGSGWCPAEKGWCQSRFGIVDSRSLRCSLLLLGLDIDPDERNLRFLRELKVIEGCVGI